jgi:stage II sporulation protein D
VTRRTSAVLSATLAAAWIASALLVAAAPEPTDTDLARASANRTVRIRVAGRITSIPSEVYVARVIAGEGEPGAPEAAQQALAIAIRTFAAANAGRHRRHGFDLCDATHCQVLRASTPASRRAALATAGQVLMYSGQPADVFYSASCGGRSEAVAEVWPGASDHPYLPSVEDDVHAGEAPWVVQIPAARIEQVLRRAGFEGRRLRDLRIERRSPSGRVSRLHLGGMRPDTIAGDDFRAALGARQLRSTAFSVEKTGNAYRFTGRGYGHGVGMCVVGARLRAARGESTAQILEQYYPGLTLAKGSLTSAAAGPSPSTTNIVTRAPAGIDRAVLTQFALSTRDELAAALGVSAPSRFTIEIFDSLDDFRQATGRPWWTSAVVDDQVILLAPPTILERRDGLEPALRRAVAEMLTATAFADRPAWVRIGAARYFASRERPAAIPHVKCPTDAELTLAVSAAAQGDAERRAEACFARAVAAHRDWRNVR